MAPLVRTGGSRHTGLAAPPHRNIHIGRLRCSAIHFPLPGHVRDLSPIRARPWRAYIKNSLSAKAISNVIL